MAFASPQDVYARKLLSHRGYPLWTPEPNVGLPECYRREGLKIGDVGVVVPEDGSFDVFFNITLPWDHRLHTADGVPNNFTQVKLGQEDYRVVPDIECPGRAIPSSTLGCTVNRIDPFYIDGKPHSMTDYQFEGQNSEGAMLILPQGAERHRLAKTLLLLDVVIQNAVEWYRFAREQLYRDISNDAIYLITGFHKAESWSLASFKNTPPCSSRCKIVQLGKAGPILPDDSTWASIRPLEWRIGPRRSDGLGIPNQTVFIVGFKISVNEELLHWKRVTVRLEHSKRTLASRLVGFGAILANTLYGMPPEAEHLPQATTQDEGAKESPSQCDPPEHVCVENVPQILQPFHPSDVINRYMLKKEPSAKIAVTHDSQWITLLEKGMISRHDVLQAERLEAAVSKEYNIITDNGVVYLRNIDPSTPMGTGTMTTEIAQLHHIDTSPGTSQQMSPFNSDSTSEDAVMLLHNASLLKQHECKWAIETGTGMRIQQCGFYGPIKDFAHHMSSCHGLHGPGQTRIRCCWANCAVEFKKESLMRHIQEKHLELKYPCPYCTEQFIRILTLRNHIQRAHSSNFTRKDVVV